jgi:hypothetical protein
MQRDKQFRVVGCWALASDGAQWVLQYGTGKNWQALSFVRTTKDILAGCVLEKGVPTDTAAQLLDGLPDDFDAWHAQFIRTGHRHGGQTGKIVMTAMESPLSKAA